ncbi:MAG: hypothetical protein HYX60_04110 [Legionella longbeachae]|nr:hypothetical protein [Legionella longbeachae]
MYLKQDRYFYKLTDNHTIDVSGLGTRTIKDPNMLSIYELDNCSKELRESLDIVVKILNDVENKLKEYPLILEYPQQLQYLKQLKEYLQRTKKCMIMHILF